MKRIYIASPYTKGDVAMNVKRQMDVADELIDLGFAPFAPLMSHFHQLLHPLPYCVWMSLDMEWLMVCDAVLRLDGESEGADAEVGVAINHGIPVYYSIEELTRVI